MIEHGLRWEWPAKNGEEPRVQIDRHVSAESAGGIKAIVNRLDPHITLTVVSRTVSYGEWSQVK